MTSFILASTSASRQTILRQAGLTFEAVAPYVDEDEIKLALRAEGANARDVAESLGEAKALKVSRRFPGALVLGCDQVLSYGDNQMLDKPKDMAEARRHLEILSGKRHQLIGAAIIALDGKPIWRTIESATLSMRILGSDFIDAYLAREGDVLLTTVGAYRLEALGAQLFSHIEGDYFQILGLPLLSVLGFLRDRKVILA
jgi:septum formation protein